MLLDEVLPSACQVLECCVMSDAPEPGLETGSISVVLPKVLKGCHKRLLHYIFHICLLADEAGDEARQCTAVLPDQLAERFRSSAEDVLYEFSFVCLH